MSFLQHGNWILIDPDTPSIDLFEATLDLETLCDLLRCDATDLVQINGSLHGYIDGEGELQERQTPWRFNGVDCFGPMLLFHLSEDETEMLSCDEDDLEALADVVEFPHHTP